MTSFIRSSDVWSCETEISIHEKNILFLKIKTTFLVAQIRQQIEFKR